MLQVALLDGAMAWVVAIECGGERVRVCRHGVRGAVLERQSHGGHQVLVCVLVLVDVGEIEVCELQHGLHVLRCGAAGHVDRGLSQTQVSIGYLACQSLVELGTAEVAQSAYADDLVEELQIGPVRGFVEDLFIEQPCD